LSGFILLASSIWQLFNGSKTIGFLQLLVLAMSILYFGFVIYVMFSIFNKPNSKVALERVEPLIKEKTDLIIPKKYEILKNLIEHTEGAIDSDYSIKLTIKYEESDQKYVVQQILNQLNSKSEKGIWKPYENGFNFKHSGNENNRAEPFYFQVDTLANSMKLNLSHL